MKVIILAGGYGTRLSEYTDLVPKPMVNIGNKPIVQHIMEHYDFFGHNDFYLALGYLANYVKKFFIDFNITNRDFSINTSDVKIDFHNKPNYNWNINCIDTGLDTLTGKRIKMLEQYIDGETFMLTYGDGLANVDLDKLLDFHKSHNKMITMTAVRPKARFGELLLDENKVLEFKEKPQMKQGWINGGFFVINSSFFKTLNEDNVMLEREPLERACKNGELMVYKHEGFWQSMDSKRDHDLLNKLYEENNLLWKNFNEK